MIRQVGPPSPAPPNCNDPDIAILIYFYFLRSSIIAFTIAPKAFRLLASAITSFNDGFVFKSPASFK
ncbi:hypothetical protein [Niabella hibiscisoli]|uniref:hypothetical protein n=1 Tax=Niabella hibiscisoli TaxID=1825928 RepID=UPI001F0E74B9|nr:hypothetical protein [Niabella hibiscisoli]MCH5720979.1 hypothetical protein [Niabella hibiscisoli]